MTRISKYERENKEEYFRTHVLVMQERLEEAKTNLKWISDDLKFLEKLTRQK